MTKSYDGPEVVHSNRNIRKLLNLARASTKDTFYDLGCGRGQLCIIAASEFHVKRAVGIECRRDRAKKAKQLVTNLGLASRIEIRQEDYRDSDLSDATIAYNGLMEEKIDFDFYSNSLSTGCKLVTLQLPLVGVVPSAQDYPFYVMRVPFRRTRNAQKWLSLVLSRDRTNLRSFIQELTDDPDYATDIRSLKALINARFTS